MKRGNVPWVALVLIGLNLLGALGALLNPTLNDRLGFWVTRPNPFHALTSIFLHANVLHLLGNLVFLAAVGPLVEFASKWWRFLIVYLTSGIAGVIAHAVILRGMEWTPPLIGASGAVAGCVAYASVLYVGYRVPVAPRLAVPVSGMALIWLALQGIGAVVRIGETEQGGAAFWAHIAGFLSGVVFAFVFRAPRTARLRIGHETLDAMNSRGPGAVLAAAEAVLREHPTDQRAHRQRCEALRDLHEDEEAVTALLEWLQQSSDQDKVAAIRMLSEMHALDQIPAMRRAQLADWLKEDDPDAARLLLESLASASDDDPYRPDALLALSELTVESDPERSAAVREELLLKYALHGAAQVARQKGLTP
ncbi:MAG: rhomboid family intramembrane serine protease [Fimbriimonadaceae bacterium]|nr:rhomboid family intramembrane serine protease [Fimbriimonadaceae bacterium]